ncbi:DUF6756 family protein [Flavobacterium sp. FlaQc-48]|uniref:DUF6756 family protein n=1 Tax=Flavobacterium sp. FlaQc-48 TaxID=3374181 RepID=UPI0037581560
MVKKRHLLRKEWASLRTEIAQITESKNIPETEFRPLSIYDKWDKIEEKIYRSFCTSGYSSKKKRWLWIFFKLDTFSLSNLPERPENYLDKLIDESETVWYIVNETINEANKFWFYEGKIKTIQMIINESWFDELYLVSKKYEWLICINHHDSLIATGEKMTTKLKLMEIKNQ